MPGEMTLSVIIPIYNEARFVDELIRKVKAAEVPAGITKEIIIVDDGSTDGTPETLRKYTFLEEKLVGE